MLCTIRNIKGLSFPVITIHTGILVTFAGVVISSFGYVATINVYEGDTVGTVYRWDKEKDMPLGVDLTVKKINLEYYPAPVKVGVMKGDLKYKLFELKTGDRFQLDQYSVEVVSLDFVSNNLKINVFDGDHYIGYAETAGTKNLPDGFPYDFVLVAYVNSPLKKVWVDLALSRDASVVAEGKSAVNDPFSWNDLNFHHVNVDYDAYGNPYAGIQITYDPGLNYVLSGFVVLGIGSLLYLHRKLRGRR